MKLRHLIYKILRIIWKITKPNTMGARIVLIKNDQVLLVKHSYQSEWYIPGGGLKKGETYEEGIRRELMEELGAKLNSINFLGVYNNQYEGKNDSIVIFFSDDFSYDGIRDNEISNIEFFPLDKLPEEISPGSKRRITEYLSKSFPVFSKW